MGPSPYCLSWRQSNGCCPPPIGTGTLWSNRYYGIGMNHTISANPNLLSSHSRIPEEAGLWSRYAHTRTHTSHLPLLPQSLSSGLPALLLEMLDWRKATTGAEGSSLWRNRTAAAAVAASTAASSSTNTIGASTLVATGAGAAAVTEQDLSVLRVVAVEVLGALTLEGAHSTQVWGRGGEGRGGSEGGGQLWLLGRM